MLEMATTKQAAAWLESLAQALAAGDATAASNLFVDDCYWRDLLSFTWNVTTMEGREAIVDMLEATLATTKPTAWQLAGEATSDEHGSGHSDGTDASGTDEHDMTDASATGSAEASALPIVLGGTGLVLGAGALVVAVLAFRRTRS